MDYFNYSRYSTIEVCIGDTPLGGNNPIRLQSMTNKSTMDTIGCIEQAKRIVNAGGEYVRLTTQGVKEAGNLREIHKGLRNAGYQTPLVADVHFNPKVADVAATYVEKVRINPGNYVDPVKKFVELDYTEEEYAAELKKIRERFVPFLNICKEYHTAIRIGVNHGSLSDRIMSRYGDTPEGMVESCMEFLRICVAENFMNVVISIKASNTVIMVKTVRLLVATMEKEGMNFPLHLGVTEAGDGEDGRIKSALGIGTLLVDGLGDTIRVSLSEDPEFEIPVAKKIVDYIGVRKNHSPISAVSFAGYDYFSLSRRFTHAVKNIGGDNLPVVIAESEGGKVNINPQFTPDYLFVQQLPEHIGESTSFLIPVNNWKDKKNLFPVFTVKQSDVIGEYNVNLKFLLLSFEELNEEILTLLKDHPEIVVIAKSTHINRVGELRAMVHTFLNSGVTNPVVFLHTYQEDDMESFQVKSAIDMGPLTLDGFCDGIFLTNQGSLSKETIITAAFGILQAGRVRTSKTEYISCPGCGRTLFDLQATIARVKEATSHLKGLKIGIMGCIVNGPGEMADADYGYVGAGMGKVSLYKRKECVERNIPEEEAVDKLIELIKLNGDF